MKREASLKAIRESGADIIIYTDGSAEGGTRNGGSAAVITINDPSSAQIIQTLRKRGRRITCSYEEETAAMIEAVKWARRVDGDRVLIVTDSQSLFSALASVEPNPEIAHLKKMLTETTNVQLQWVPSHCGIPGNELADEAVNEAWEADG